MQRNASNMWSEIKESWKPANLWKLTKKYSIAIPIGIAIGIVLTCMR